MYRQPRWYCHPGGVRPSLATTRAAGTIAFPRRGALSKFVKLPKATSFSNGFIPLGEDESLLCFTNVIPTKRTRFDISSSLLVDLNVFKHEGFIRTRCLPEVLKPRLEDSKIFARPTDGVVFLQYRNVKRGTEQRDEQMVLSQIQDHLDKQHPKRWFIWSMSRSVSVFAVRGDPGPWLPDLYRFPNKRLRIEFHRTVPSEIVQLSWPPESPESSTKPGGQKIQSTGAEKNQLAQYSPGSDAGSVHETLSQQAVYALFSAYGKIVDIMPQPADCTIKPKYTTVQFKRIDSAVAAKACLDNHDVGDMPQIRGPEKGVYLSIAYERVTHMRWVKDLVNKHPRLVIPALVLILVTLAVGAFDSLREWCVWAKMERPLSHVFELLDYFRRVYKMDNMDDHLPKRLKGNLPDRKLNRLTRDEKEEYSFAGEMNKMLDVDESTPILVNGAQDAKHDIGLLLQQDRRLVMSIDFQPIAEAAALLEEGSAITKAVAKELSYPLFSRIVSFLDLLMEAWTKRNGGIMKSMEAQVDDMLNVAKIVLRQQKTKADAHMHRGKGDETRCHVRKEMYPVLVIYNLHRSKNPFINRKLEEWASEIAEEQCASVILHAKNDNSVMRSRKHRNLQYHDYASFIEQPKSQLAALAIRPSITPNSLPHQLLTSYVWAADANPSLGWTPEQAWLLIGLFAEKKPADSRKAPEISYQELRLGSGFFKLTSRAAAEAALVALAKAGMLKLHNGTGFSEAVAPAPRFADMEMFVKLREDKVLAMVLDLRVLEARARREREKIEEAAEELRRIAVLKTLPGGREKYLLGKIDDAQEGLEECERKMEMLEQDMREVSDVANDGA